LVALFVVEATDVLDHARSLSSQSLSLSLSKEETIGTHENIIIVFPQISRSERLPHQQLVQYYYSRPSFIVIFPHRDLIDRPLRGGDDDERSSIDYTVYAPSVLVRRNSAKVPILWNKQRAALLTIPDGECCAAAHSRPRGKNQAIRSRCRPPKFTQEQRTTNKVIQQSQSIRTHKS
jgi:hypothetical protein